MHTDISIGSLPEKTQEIQRMSHLHEPTLVSTLDSADLFVYLFILTLQADEAVVQMSQRLPLLRQLE